MNDLALANSMSLDQIIARLDEKGVDVSRLDEVVRSNAKMLSYRNLEFFATYFMRPYISDWMAVPEKHGEIYHKILTENRLLLEAGRDFSKSSTVSLIFPLYSIAFNRNIRILHIAGSGNAGEKFARILMKHLESNSRLIDTFGKFKQKHSVWQTRQFTVARDAVLKEPTFQSIGWQSAVVGNRVDIVILDDVEDSRNSKNPEHSRQRLQWLENDIMPMLRGGKFILVQPYQGKHDLHRLLRKKMTFTFLKIPSMEKDTNKSNWESRMPVRGHLKECAHLGKSQEEFSCADCEHHDTNIDDKIICGYCRENCTKCPIPDINQFICLTYKRNDSGEYNFRRQYMLDESVDEEKLFPSNYFERHMYDELPSGSYRIVHGYDLATGRDAKKDGKDNCMFAYTRIAINNRTGNIYVEFSDEFKKNFLEQIQMIQANHLAWAANTKLHGIESNQYQDVLSQFFELTTTVPVKPVHTSQDKYTRATHLTVFRDQGRLWFKRGQTEKVIDQLENFEEYGKTNKDTFDSLSMAIKADGISASMNQQTGNNSALVSEFSDRIGGEPAYDDLNGLGDYLGIEGIGSHLGGFDV